MMGVRTAVMTSLTLNPLGMLSRTFPIGRVSNLGVILRYGMVHFSRRRRTPMDVSKMVDLWIDAVVGMCHAHDKDEYDAHDAKADELLGPLLAAPVAQIREFYQALRDRMQTDKRVPFLVWIAFEAWGEAIVKNAPDEGVKRLKRSLAAEISDLVELPIRDQIPKAVQRALMWRDQETLESVRDTLKAGAKPTLRGRQSCLFLEAGRGKKKVSVML